MFSLNMFVVATISIVNVCTMFWTTLYKHRCSSMKTNFSSMSSNLFRRCISLHHKTGSNFIEPMGRCCGLGSFGCPFTFALGIRLDVIFCQKFMTRREGLSTVLIRWVFRYVLWPNRSVLIFDWLLFLLWIYLCDKIFVLNSQSLYKKH